MEGSIVIIVVVQIDVLHTLHELVEGVRVLSVVRFFFPLPTVLTIILCCEGMLQQDVLRSIHNTECRRSILLSRGMWSKELEGRGVDLETIFGLVFCSGRLLLCGRKAVGSVWERFFWSFRDVFRR